MRLSVGIGVTSAHVAGRALPPPHPLLPVLFLLLTPPIPTNCCACSNPMLPQALEHAPQVPPTLSPSHSALSSSIMWSLSALPPSPPSPSPSPPHPCSSMPLACSLLHSTSSASSTNAPPCCSLRRPISRLLLRNQAPVNPHLPSPLLPCSLQHPAVLTCHRLHHIPSLPHPTLPVSSSLQHPGHFPGRAEGNGTGDSGGDEAGGAAGGGSGGRNGEGQRVGVGRMEGKCWVGSPRRGGWTC